MEFSWLTKLMLSGIGEGRDVYRCGTMEYFDKTFQSVTCKFVAHILQISLPKSTSKCNYWENVFQKCCYIWLRDILCSARNGFNFYMIVLSMQVQVKMNARWGGWIGYFTRSGQPMTQLFGRWRWRNSSPEWLKAPTLVRYYMNENILTDRPPCVVKKTTRRQACYITL